MDVLRIGTALFDTELVSIPDTNHDNGDYASLRALQGLVGGYIETCAPAGLRAQGIELLANEEGLLQGLEPNFNLYPFFYVGQLVAVGIGDEDFVSLTAEQITFIMGWIEGLSL